MQSCVLQDLICGKFKRDKAVVTEIRIEVASWVGRVTGERHEGTFWAGANAIQTQEMVTRCITYQNSGHAPLKSIVPHKNTPNRTSS